jgi:hypothetical protein
MIILLFAYIFTLLLASPITTSCSLSLSLSLHAIHRYLRHLHIIIHVVLLANLDHPLVLALSRSSLIFYCYCCPALDLPSAHLSILLHLLIDHLLPVLCVVAVLPLAM